MWPRYHIATILAIVRIVAIVTPVAIATIVTIVTISKLSRRRADSTVANTAPRGTPLNTRGTEHKGAAAATGPNRV